ncbi:putative HTH-type transcriptional regulator YdfH [Labrenzia sp. THAF35]|uniref:GntR family transcriptional regulator n=1 Tax=Labrenzia sp. THAF35 TaxID=2587854 RepID=UPI0012680CA8|nr:GntR family transcriptional regulator [Labrenzia sp. THAF35]QFT65940.1 putative HTH-type transcriptional regulator YdfH [Labrenzia sp. THAF35]
MSAEKIAATLETDIVSGIFRPGEELKQGELAARFSVSRIPVRDALQLMAARGLIDLERNRRARVISLTPAEIDEVYHLRVLLETDCLRQSIRRLEADDLVKIEAALAHSSIDAATDRWADGDWVFHKSLYMPARRPRELAMIEDLRRTCRIHIAGYGVLPTLTDRWLKDHEELVAAMKSRAEDQAADILARHIADARQTLLDAMPGRTFKVPTEPQKSM